ncbi:MAG: PH domain-containing protein [Actinomycetes bacterium]
MSEPTAATGTGPVRLHPWSIVRGIDPRALAQLVPAVVVAAVSLGTGVVVPLLLVALPVVAAVRVVAWQRHTVEVTATAVVERRGVLQRRERTVELARLQQVEVEQGLLDRLLGTAVVRLETASDASDVELELQVVTLEQAHRLRASLAPAAADADGAGPDAVELVRVPMAHVALASLTGRRLLAVPALVGAAVGLLQDVAPGEELGERATDVAGTVAARLGLGAVLLLVAGVVVLTAGAALVTGMLRDGDFRIHEVGDDLHVRRGLLAVREAVVPRARLQLVTVHHGWLRRQLGFASLTLHSAGGAGGDAVERSLTVPLVPTAAAKPLALALLPDAGPLPPLAPHPPAGRRRARVRAGLRLAWVPLALLGPTWAFTGSAGAAAVAAGAALVAVVALAWVVGTADHRRRASALAGGWLVTRQGAFVVVEAYAPSGKAQGVTVRSSPFQRRLGLATLLVPVAGHGGGVEVLDVDEARADAWASSLLSAGSAAP